MEFDENFSACRKKFISFLKNFNRKSFELKFIQLRISYSEICEFFSLLENCKNFLLFPSAH